MKTLAFVIFSVLLLCLGLAACGGDLDAGQRLDRADAIMDSIPDTALTILHEIDRSRLSDADAARHALLLSQAYDKKAVDIADDSLIAIARDYYFTHPGRRDLLARAYYYSGVVAFNAADYPGSIYYLSLADTLAAGVADHRLRGMANAMLAWSNSELLDLENEYRHAERALRFFTLVGDSARTSRQMLYVAICHLQLHRPAEALAMLDSPGCEPEPVTRASSLVELGRLDEFHAMLARCPYLAEDSKLMSRYARQLVRSGNLTEADSALARAFRNAKNSSDTASCMGVKAELLKSRGDIYGYSDILRHQLSATSALLLATMRDSRTSGYADALRTISSIEQHDTIHRHKLHILSLLIIVTVIIVALIIIIVIARMRHITSGLRYKSLLKSVRLECIARGAEAKSRGIENRKLSEAYNALSENMIRYDASSLVELTAKIKAQIDNKLSEYLAVPSTDKTRKTQLMAEISAILTVERKEILERCVDMSHPGIIEAMRNAGAKAIDIDVYVLENLGMGNSTITLLTQSTSEKSVSCRRTRIHKMVERLTATVPVEQSTSEKQARE